MFQLNPVLAGDTTTIGSLGLCSVLLMRDTRYPWLILVPAIPGLVEIGDLDRDDRIRLMDETDTVAKALSRLFTPDKINIGALGNIVRQLHVHIVARNHGDPAWPGPVWGHSAAEDYSTTALNTRVAEMRETLNMSSAAPAN